MPKLSIGPDLKESGASLRHLNLLPKCPYSLQIYQAYSKLEIGSKSVDVLRKMLGSMFLIIKASVTKSRSTSKENSSV